MNYLYIWKEGKHFKIKYFPKEKKSRIECIKKNKVKNRLDKLNKEGWHIIIKKPVEG